MEQQQQDIKSKFVPGRDATFYANLFLDLSEDEKQKFFNTTTSAERIRLMRIPVKQQGKFNKPGFTLFQLSEYAFTKAHRKELHREARDKEFVEKILPKLERQWKLEQAYKIDEEN